MKSVLDVLSDEQRTDPDVREQRVADAYAATFSGRGTRDDAEIVLVDLAVYTRYYDTAPIDVTGDVAKAFDQRRAPMYRIMEALALGNEEPSGLLTAVLKYIEEIPE